MDPSELEINPPSVSGTEPEQVEGATNASSEASNGPSTTISDALSTPSPSIPPAEELEHAYWAEFEEDTTVPDEGELEEIDGAEADYSASDRRFPAWPPTCPSDSVKVTNVVQRSLLGRQLLPRLRRS